VRKAFGREHSKIEIWKVEIFASESLSKDLKGATENKLQSSWHCDTERATHPENPPFHGILQTPPSAFPTAPLGTGSGNFQTIRATSDAVIIAKDRCWIRFNIGQITDSFCSDVSHWIVLSLGIDVTD
jgi:hypothetical protein